MNNNKININENNSNSDDKKTTKLAPLFLIIILKTC